MSLYDIVEHDDSTWLVMEFVPSQTLAEVLRQQGRLPVDRVVRIGTQIASALAAAHALGIVHRDVKPGNILVSERDLAKLSDFGIARGRHDEQLTLTGFVSGTPAYFSPEPARGGEPSQASDVWALGATLYAAVEGAPPYGKDANPLALLARIASQPPPRPAHAGRLRSTLATMLNPRPEARASMESVVAALHRLAGPRDVTAARVRERRREYADTTLHDRPVLGFAQAPAQSPGRAPDRVPEPSRDRTPDLAPHRAPHRRPAGEPRPDRIVRDGHPHRPASMVPESVVPDSRAVGAPGGPPVGASPTPVELGERAAPVAGRRRPSLAFVVVGIVLVLVLAVGGLLAWSILRAPGGSEATPPTPATVHHGRTGPGTGHSTGSGTRSSSGTGTTPSGSTSSVPTSPTSPTSPTITQVPPPPSGSDPAAFVTSYYETVPADLDTGWLELAPSMQTIGRSSYDKFWHSIDSVAVQDVHQVSADAVDYQITYHFSTGRVVQEDQRLELAPHDDGYWITDETVLHSTTLHP